MEMNPEFEEQTPQEQGYQPRPAWQVWAARVGLVIFLLFVAYQIMQIAGGWQ
jgi:hypothetical protein